MIDALRFKKMKKVLAFGTFDILHKGHIYFLKSAKSFGELTVVVSRDKTVKKIKNKRPVNDEKKRLNNIRKLNIAKRVILGYINNKYKVIQKIKPDIISLGYDQKHFVDDLKKELKKLKLKTKVVRLKSYKPKTYKSSKLRRFID